MNKYIITIFDFPKEPGESDPDNVARHSDQDSVESNNRLVVSANIKYTFFTTTKVSPLSLSHTFILMSGPTKENFFLSIVCPDNFKFRIQELKLFGCGKVILLCEKNEKNNFDFKKKDIAVILFLTVIRFLL